MLAQHDGLGNCFEESLDIDWCDRHPMYALGSCPICPQCPMCQQQNPDDEDDNDGDFGPF